MHDCDICGEPLGGDDRTMHQYTSHGETVHHCHARCLAHFTRQFSGGVGYDGTWFARALDRLGVAADDPPRFE